MLYFFLSYARGDEDELIQAFFQDLSTEVRLRAGASRDTVVGFVDQTIQVGERWPRRLTEAVATCGSFLALMTPRYFQSEPCGKEWQLFAERARRYDAQGGSESSLLKPLIWVPTPPTKMHTVAQPLQYTSGSLGEIYERLGVRQLMRLKRHQDDYRLFIFELAGQIVEGVERHAIPNGRRNADFHTLISAFHGGPISRRAARSLTPMLVHIVVAAATRRELRDVREDLSYYGERPIDWAPYRPPLPEPLAEYARGIASDHSFDARVADVYALPDHAYEAGQIVVLLVDVWVTRIEEAHRMLTAHHERAVSDPPLVTAVLIPRSRDDAETRGHWPTLSPACRRIFQRLVHDDELYRPGIGTHRAFELDLPEVLEVARNRVYRTAPPRRPLDDDVNTEPPQVDGPWTYPEAEEP